MTPDIQQKLAGVSNRPGVYLMKDIEGKILYVGKAANLKKRISAYFRPPDRLDLKTRMMMIRMSDFETILCDSEKEALILESNLIKKYRPRYNVILKDDKRYPSLRLDLNEPYPNLTVARKIGKDGALYFGPYSSAQAVRQTVRFIDKTFRLRKCRQRELRHRSRPCIHCQMQRCLAPCCMDVSPERYREVVREVILFLKGRAPELIREVKAQMLAAAETRDFERAARLRDKMFALQNTMEKQVAVTTDFMDRDVIATAQSETGSIVALLPVRAGFLTGARHYSFAERGLDESELIEIFIRQHYEDISFLPSEIIVSALPDGIHLMEEWLKERKGERVRILQPKRGQKARLLEMARRNAQDRLRDRRQSEAAEAQTLHRLGRRLRIERPLVRIECVDTSNLFGDAQAASIVVFLHGRPHPDLYRRYRIRSVSGPDDYSAMAEVLGRRFGKGGASHPLPDLLMVDGGKGQINIARDVLKGLGLAETIPVVGIAKKDESRGETEDKIYLAGRQNPVQFGKDADPLLLLQRIRDEAHRFAIGFHRKRKRRESLSSALDIVPGIGKQRKGALIRHFGGVEAIRLASTEELSAVPGIYPKLAEKIRAHLGAGKTTNGAMEREKEPGNREEGPKAS